MTAIDNNDVSSVARAGALDALAELYEKADMDAPDMPEQYAYCLHKIESAPEELFLAPEGGEEVRGVSLSPEDLNTENLRRIICPGADSCSDLTLQDIQNALPDDYVNIDIHSWDPSRPCDDPRGYEQKIECVETAAENVAERFLDTVFYPFR